VLADITQLRQIVMNLVINAADAIADRPGVITITTYARTVDAAFLRTSLGHPELPAGTYVGLEVADSGVGMPPETIARIFEPFFSTKFSGRGLGLAAVRGIVQAHRGALFVESQPGAGSTFRLLLPATQGDAVSSATPFPPPAAGPVKLTGLVLVVDDEPTVRDIVSAVLEAHGASVLPAADGEAALALLRVNAGRIALVLLDMTMPGISGEETLRRFRMMNFRHPVILMSGYSETETMKRSTDLGVAGFVQKPFEIGPFLDRVKPFLG
jgi:CheY-like chemotaxis protein